MDRTEICRICLSTDNKLFIDMNVKQHNLLQIYQYISGIQLSDEERLPTTICMQCGTQLVACDKLRNTAVKSQQILTEVLQKYHCISKQYVELVNNEFENKPYSTQEEDNSQIKKENNESQLPLKEPKLEIEVVGDFTQFYYTESAPSSSDETLSVAKKKKKKIRTKVSKEKKIVLKRKAPKLETKKNKIKTIKKKRVVDYLNCFNVSILSYEEQLNEILKKKEQTTFKNGVFKCMECYKGFMDEDSYNLHMIKHSDKSGAFTCDICKHHYATKKAVLHHLTASHVKRFSCKSCVFSTTFTETARRHSKWHKGVTHECPHCSTVFTRYTSFLGHLRLKHPSDFVCELCGYCFVSAKGRDLHKRLKHRWDQATHIQTPLEGPRCSPCNVRFVSEEAYHKHLQVSARHENKALNDTKRPVYKKKGERKPRTASQRSPITCEQCGKLLTSKQAYTWHYRRDHPEVSVAPSSVCEGGSMCDLCGSTFSNTTLLAYHRRVHTGEKPFKCDKCDKAFRIKQSLINHSAIHATDRVTYPCTLCGKQFSNKQNVQRHFIVHTGLRPFACDVCGKTFKTFGEKKAHHTYVHLKVPWPKKQKRQGLDTMKTGMGFE